MQSNIIKVSGDILTKQLVGRIYAESDISKFRYEMLNYVQDLPKLSKNKFFVSLNFCGTNCLLVFTKIQDKFYSFVVDRQTLSYNFSKVDFSKIKLNQIKLSLDDSIYDGTIFEGILIKRHGLDDLYIISDVYKFCGKNMINEKLNIKLLTIVEYLKSNYDSDSRDNTIEIQVNKIYELNKFDYFYKEVMPKIKNLKYRGICFYPEISETKLIFMLNDINSSRNESRNESRNDIANKTNTKYISIKSNSIKSNSIKSNSIKSNSNSNDDDNIDGNLNININKINKDNKSDKKTKYVNTTSEDVYVVLEVKSTDNPDVYKLNCVEKQIVDKKMMLKKISMGIAHIRGIDMSHKMKKIFENKKSVLMNCKFNDDNSKFEPLNVNTESKFPTLLEEIESKLAIMENSDSE